MKVLLIDFYNLIHRARHGFGASGPHSMTYNALRMIRSEVNNHKPDITYIVNEGRSERRIKIDPEYKGNRTPVQDPYFTPQRNEILAACSYLPNVVIARHPFREADDIIAHLACITHAEDDIVIVSSDSDFLQIADGCRIKLWNPIKKSWCLWQDCNYLIWKSLAGDSTDNVPGVKGIGPAKAKKLASNLDLLQEFLSNPEKRSEYNQSYSLIIFDNVDKDDECLNIVKSAYDESKLREMFEFAEFTSLLSPASIAKFVAPFRKE